MCQGSTAVHCPLPLWWIMPPQLTFQFTELHHCMYCIYKTVHKPTCYSTSYVYCSIGYRKYKLPCVNSSIGVHVLENVVSATKIMVLGGLEPEILVIIVSGVIHFRKWPPSLLWDKTANGPTSQNIHQDMP